MFRDFLYWFDHKSAKFEIFLIALLISAVYFGVGSVVHVVKVHRDHEISAQKLRKHHDRHVQIYQLAGTNPKMKQIVVKRQGTMMTDKKDAHVIYQIDAKTNKIAGVSYVYSPYNTTTSVVKEECQGVLGDSNLLFTKKKIISDDYDLKNNKITDIYSPQNHRWFNVSLTSGFNDTVSLMRFQAGKNKLKLSPESTKKSLDMANNINNQLKTNPQYGGVSVLNQRGQYLVTIPIANNNSKQVNDMQKYLTGIRDLILKTDKNAKYISFNWDGSDRNMLGQWQVGDRDVTIYKYDVKVNKPQQADQGSNGPGQGNQGEQGQGQNNQQPQSQNSK